MKRRLRKKGMKLLLDGSRSRLAKRFHSRNWARVVSGYWPRKR